MHHLQWLSEGSYQATALPVWLDTENRYCKDYLSCFLQRWEISSYVIILMRQSESYSADWSSNPAISSDTQVPRKIRGPTELRNCSPAVVCLLWDQKSLQCGCSSTHFPRSSMCGWAVDRSLSWEVFWTQPGCKRRWGLLGCDWYRCNLVEARVHSEVLPLEWVMVVTVGR